MLLWWATNTRCAAVLANAALAAGIPIALVLDPAAPQPSADVLDGAVVLERRTAPLARAELVALVARATAALAVDQVVLAPTSEYLLDTLHVELAGELPPALVVPSTATVSYRELSSKHWGAACFAGRPAVQPPREVTGVEKDMPFVAKPRVNLLRGEVLKPFLVDDDRSLERYTQLAAAYFPQEFVPGPSFYWCAYRARDGAVTDYFQRNLLQRPGGDSIVLAAEQSPPGADAIRATLRAVLDEIGFVGPAMVEMRGEPPRFIELNPRFWGPLLLDALTGGRVTDAFFRDQFDVPFQQFLSSQTLSSARLYVVPSALDETLVTVSGTREQTTNVPAELRPVLLEAAGFDPRHLGGDW